MRLGGALVLLVVAAGLFAAFFLNVVLGASGSAPFLSDVGELLTLFASCIFFVAATLRLEKNKQNRATRAELEG